MARRQSKPKRRDPAAEIEKIRETGRDVDSTPELVAVAKFLRRMLPGDKEPQSGHPSAIRELGSAAVGAWEAASEAQRKRRGEVDLAILFTDLVGFSDWALGAGDEAALKLLSEVSAAESDAISDNGGALVKRLGDGAMAVFSEADAAVKAALDAQKAVGKVKVEGHKPKLRAGVHYGRPQRVRKDFLGVDVNIAARVGEAAKGNEVLVSDSAREAIEGSGFKFGSKRPLKAPGAPRDLTICPVTR